MQLGRAAFAAVGILGVLAVPTTALAQDAARGEFLTNPIGLVFGLYGLELGIGLTDRASLNVGGSYAGSSAGSVDVTAIGLGGGVQFFFGGALYNGWFGYPRLGYASATASNQNQKAEVSVLSFGALFGYQWDWKPFTLRLGGGAAYNSISVTGDESLETGFEGIAPVFDGSIGLTF